MHPLRFLGAQLCAGRATCFRAEGWRRWVGEGGVGFRGSAHDELGALRLLLRDLLGLNGARVLAAEGQLRDGHIVQHDVEVLRALSQHVPDVPAYDLGTRARTAIGSEPPQPGQLIITHDCRRLASISGSKVNLHC